MIDTLGTIAERIIRDLSGGDIPSDSPYKVEFVAAHIRDALREDLKLEILTRRGQGGRDDDRSPITQYIATYPDVVIDVDKPTQRAFITLPTNYISLKFNKGIHAISLMNQPNKRMIPVANPAVTSNLRHGDFEQNNFGYYVEGMKVFFMRNIKKDEVNKVLLKLIVPAPDTWGLDDPLPLIPENLARVMDVVKTRVQNRVIQDRLNDNNPNPRVTNA